ncbi:MAG: peptidylprolyl isomerase [Minicystis sp.]
MRRSSRSSPRVPAAFIAIVLAACDPPALPPAPAPAAPPATLVPSPPPPPTDPLPGPWASAAALAPSAAPSAPVEAVPAYAPGREVAGAAHILIAYKGAQGAAPTITRSKDEARKLCAALRDKLLDNKATFEELVKQYSDDPLSRNTGGAIGTFEHYAMPGPFADATFGMKVGSLSEPVETPRGFHLIRRTR